MPTLILTEGPRLRLKQPLGELVRGTSAECIRRLREVVNSEHPPSVVLVGDSVSKNAIVSGLQADVIIVDHLEKRQKAPRFDYKAKNLFRAENAAGTITAEAWRIVEQALRQGESLVEIEGEEDLLALVAILVSPEGSLVVYGQPGEGIVLVRTSVEKKAEVNQIIEQMSKSE